jgi:non-ribosomal peptide synthase protein (TIGR01720 family)
MRMVPWSGDGDALRGGIAVEQQGLNYEQGPVVRAAWFDAGAAPGRLLIVAHHLAVDGVSWRILLDDLDALYRDPGARLGDETATPSQWAAAVSASMDTGEWAEDIAFWSSTRVAAAPLPHDVQTEAQPGAPREAVIALDRSDTSTLQDRLAATDVRVDEAVIAAVWRALARWTGRRRQWIDVERHGREDDLPGAPDVSRTIGWFTSLYPVALDHRGDDDAGAWLLATRERLRAIPRRGATFGFLRYGDSPVATHLASLPRREVVINYLGRFDEVAAGSAFGPAPERVTGLRAAGVVPHALDINASTVSGCLTVTIGYSEAVHSDAAIAALSQWVLESLRLFAASTEPAQPAEYGDAGLSQDDLGRLLSKLAGEPTA